ncbi:MAG TPA: hypothetical protein VJK02_23280 [Anaerolineales bacterium]|nr:hypothetical protein [Anaerolineales bacterium]
MEDYEKLGAFYLGRPYSLEKQKAMEGLLLYDSKDLVTHAVCVGMTGSGKTGLCISILEEAAIDGIPSIVIDPKGDLPNLMLTFPELRGQDFLPWINTEDARKKGLSAQEFADQQAELWKKGLADWGQSGDRIRRLRDSAEVVIYTPGSSAGLPVSILKSFSAPGRAILEDSELLQERITTTATSLLGLMGIEADPMQSREHILLSTILDKAWKQGQELDLAGLIQQVQSPPVDKIGVLDLESFYPSKDRFGLVMALNNMLAAPGFSAWMEGEALDIAQMLHTGAGKPRVSIFSIAHLNDPERMFFVSLLLTQVLGWMRNQSGTTSLRALLYMDEIFGFFPPVANPPSKAPLITLLKQARAFGLGVLLATQNPVDLDYKGLSNAGTWFIGRLQTERDKARVLESLEGAAATAAANFDRQRMEQILAGLGSRIFLLNNTHEDAPEVFQTRWAMSYLRGPLTRDQIKVLMDPVKAAHPAQASGGLPRDALQPGGAGAAAVAAGGSVGVVGAPAPIPPDVPQFFIPARGSGPSGSTLVYQPAILGSAKLNFTNTKTGVEQTRDVAYLTEVTDEAIPVSWEAAREAGVDLSDLEKSAPGAGQYAELPQAAAKAKNYTAWSKDFVAWLYGSQKLELFKSPSLGEVSMPGEAERDFRVRLQQSARERRDEAVEKLRQKYAPKLASRQERLRRAQQTVEREAEQAKHQQVQTAISVGATLLGAFAGRKVLGTSTLGRATTAARGASRSLKEQQDIGRAKETVETIQQELADLDAEFKAMTEEMESKLDPLTETLETITIKPKKSEISVQMVALAWAPFWQGAGGEARPAWS